MKKAILIGVTGLIGTELLFSVMGTTKKKAGSEAVQYKIDYTYQYNAAKMALNSWCCYPLLAQIQKLKCFIQELKESWMRPFKN